MRTYRYLIAAHRIVGICMIIGFFSYLLHAHIPFTGTKTIVYTSDALHGQIGRLRPLDRIPQDTLANGRHIDRMVEDPVYLDLKTIVPFDKARLSVFYKNETPYALSLGVNAAEKGWNIQTKELEIEEGEDGWTIGSSEFDLTAVQRRKEVYQFLISAPGLRYEKHEGSIFISKIIIHLQRKPVSLSDFAFLAKKFSAKLSP